MKEKDAIRLANQAIHGNYIRKLLKEAKDQHIAGGVHFANVAHDEWCDLLAGRGPCNCDPDITVYPDKEPA